MCTTSWYIYQYALHGLHLCQEVKTLVYSPYNRSCSFIRSVYQMIPLRKQSLLKSYRCIVYRCSSTRAHLTSVTSHCKFTREGNTIRVPRPIITITTYIIKKWLLIIAWLQLANARYLYIVTRVYNVHVGHKYILSPSSETQLPHSRLGSYIPVPTALIPLAVLQGMTTLSTAGVTLMELRLPRVGRH